jgi:hypothetical protein
MADSSTERLSTSEASRVAGMSPDRLRRRFGAGEVEAELVAGRWVTTRQAVERYLAERGGER